MNPFKTPWPYLMAFRIEYRHCNCREFYEETQIEVLNLEQLKAFGKHFVIQDVI